MNSQAMAARQIPPEITEKYDAWRYWASFWNRVNIVVGGLSVGLSTIIAANTKQDFLGSYAIWVASAAAITSFVLSALNPQKAATGLKNAYRHLEKAIATFRFDPSATEAALGEAESQAINLLD